MRRKLEEEGIPDKYDGPSAAQIAIYQRMMQIRDGIVNICVVRLYNLFVAPVVRILAGPSPSSNATDANNTGTKLKYLRTSIPPNTPRIVDTLMRVHGYQLLVDGYVYQLCNCRITRAYPLLS